MLDEPCFDPFITIFSIINVFLLKLFIFGQFYIENWNLVELILFPDLTIESKDTIPDDSIETIKGQHYETGHVRFAAVQFFLNHLYELLHLVFLVLLTVYIVLILVQLVRCSVAIIRQLLKSNIRIRLAWQ